MNKLEQTVSKTTAITISIEIGATCVPISKQLEGRIDPNSAGHLDADSRAITRCYISGLITDSACTRARKLLLHKCVKAMREFAGLKGGRP